MQILRDFHHPAPWLDMDWLNMLFNHVADVKPQLFSKLAQLGKEQGML